MEFRLGRTGLIGRQKLRVVLTASGCLMRRHYQLLCSLITTELCDGHKSESRFRHLPPVLTIDNCVVATAFPSSATQLFEEEGNAGAD